MALTHTSAGTPKTLETLDGTKYAYIYSAPLSAKPTFLLLHGFPSSSYDWRFQIKGLTELGYGVVAPDLLGYGDTDKPYELERYRFKTMASDIAQILDSGLLSRVANYFPEKLSAFVFVSVPYMEPGVFDLDSMNTMTEQAFGYPTFGYWKFFDEGEAAKICQQNNVSVTFILYPQTPELWTTELAPLEAAKSWVTSNTVKEPPTWLSEPEVNIHNEILGKGGYTGPLNWYKATIRGLNTEDDAQVPEDNKFITFPTLVVVSDQDYVTRAEVAEQLSPIRLRNFTIKKVVGCGHWIPLEKKEEFLKILIKFAESVKGMGK